MSVMRFFTCCLILFTSLSAIGQTKFYATSSAKEVLQGRTFSVEYTMENADINGFTPPSFKPFKVVSGPAKSSSVSIVNGRKTSKASYSYGLLTDKVGTYTIPPATVKVGGKTLKTKSIKVEVVKASKQASNSSEFFVRMEVSDSLVYPGQQVILDYQLYTTKDVNNATLLNEPEYDGFFVEELRVKNGYTQIVYNGEQYYTRSLKKIALFPQQVGTYNFNPVSMQLSIPTGRRRGFFPEVTNESLITNGLSIQVAGLPPNAPPSFSGAVGKYTASVTTQKKTITTDDAIAINITVTGNGDNKYVSAPDLVLPDNLELYDPNTIQDEVTVKDGQKLHAKTFEYLIVAEKPGRYIIDPKFTYMDTDSNSYVTLSPRKLSVNVLKGTGVANRPVSVEEVETIGPISQTTKLRNTSTLFFGTMPYFLLLSLFGASVVGIYSYRQRLIKSGAFDALVQRKKQAKLKVIKELDSLLAAVNSSDSKAKTEVISSKFNSYITQKFATTDLQFTDQQVVALLKEQELPDSLVQRTSKFLSDCQMAIYAGVTSDSQLYDEVVSIIEEIDGGTEIGQ